MSALFSHLAPFLPADAADDMQRIAESFGSFGTYGAEASNDGLGEELPQRFDAAFNYVARGIDGRGNEDDRATAIARTNYFRETYAYGNDIQAPGIEPFLNHPALEATAREISGRRIIVPAIVYANLLIPGQELALHTDVPEFRGASRKVLPQWLLVTMLHSGMFDPWRIPIATCVSWFGGSEGGAFTFHPNGPASTQESIPVAHNTAIILDTDRVFHGVERVTQTRPELPPITPTTRLHFGGHDQWQLRQGDEALAQYHWPQLRYSISWKAYCFETDAEQTLWREGHDDLTVEFILEHLEAKLRERGILQGPRPEPTPFALMLVKSFVHFPPPASPA